MFAQILMNQTLNQVPPLDYKFLEGKNHNLFIDIPPEPNIVTYQWKDR